MKQSFDLVQWSVEASTSVQKEPLLLNDVLTGCENTIPVHVLSPSADFLDIGGPFLIALDMFTLRTQHVSTDIHSEEYKGTLVVPKPDIPIIAIMASSSALVASISSPSSPTSGVPSCGEVVNDAPNKCVNLQRTIEIGWDDTWRS